MTVLQTINDPVWTTAVEAEPGYTDDSGNEPTSTNAFNVLAISWRACSVTPSGNEPEPDREAWARFARRAHSRWARENPF